MNMRTVCGAVAAAIVAFTPVSAQTVNRPAAEPAAQAGAAAGEITLVGCLQREADYRRLHDSGRGGVAATGLGRGNEYILVSAIRTESAAAASELDCGTIGVTSGAPGEAYELTGESERQLEAYVGRKVAVTGTLKDADTDQDSVGTSGTAAATPTGGFDPLGQDLRLFELNVTSFSEVVAMPADQPVQAQPGTAAAAPATQEPAPAAVSSERELPATASPLPLAGLLGLLSLGGALTLRALRR